MAILLSCQSLTKAYSHRPLFREISIGLEEKQKMGLIGPNGAGKSTLLKILAGEEKPDAGVLSLRRGSRMGYIAQVDLIPPQMTVEEVLHDALKDAEGEDYEKATRVDIMLGRVGFPRPEQPVGELSGGWRKRVAIARAIIQEPDLLLLDEPTNHLDLEGILWLEKLLRSAPFAFILVSHDRYFLENVTTRVVELNRAYPDGCFSVEGNYSEFIVKREEFLASQAHQEMALANQVRREVEWLRRGPQGRATKQQARIKQAGQMMDDLAELRIRNNQGATVGVDFEGTGRKTKEMFWVKDLQKTRGGRLLFRKLNFILGSRTRLGLLGSNGSGKSTLLKLLTGDLSPDAGQVKRADRLRVVLFDQNREQLDLGVSLKVALAGDRDTVEYQGQTIHVTSWAKRFLFSTEQLTVAVSELSGGEQARILIARLMLKPADVLILDEPTNDLDIPSLEVLEESLLEFPGALVLVTHDRYMLDRVSTELLSLDGNGTTRFFADYAQWESAQRSISSPPKPAAPLKQAAPAGPPVRAATTLTTGSQPRGLTVKEQKEWSGMENRIMAAEAELETRTATIVDPAVASDHIRQRQASEELQAAQERVDKLYERWEELEARR